MFANSLLLEQTFTFGLDKKQSIEDLSGQLTLDLQFDDNGVITGASGSIAAVPLFDEPAL